MEIYTITIKDRKTGVQVTVKHKAYKTHNQAVNALNVYAKNIVAEGKRVDEMLNDNNKLVGFTVFDDRKIFFNIETLFLE